jgi:integrase/recombinase XerC
MTGVAADNRVWVDSYLEQLRTQRQLSPHTISNYRRDLAGLLRLAEAQQKAAPLAAVTQFQVRKFAAQLHAGGLSPRSIARELSCWRGFFDWLADQPAGLPSNPVDGVKAPKRGKPLPKALSADDSVRLVAQSGADPEATLQGCNRAMFELLYSSGLRVSELVGLDLRYTKDGPYASAGWVDFDAHEVTVTGKGGKIRSVPVGSAAMAALADWIAVRTVLLKTDAAPLFLSERGTRMSVRVVQLRLKAHAQALGLPTAVHPHMLRHSFASHVLQSSGDLRAVQEMLGHASIAATQVYTSLDFQRLAQVYDAAHPRARKKP